MTAKSRIDTHDEDEVQLSGNTGQGRYGRRRIEGHAGLHPGFMDLLQNAVQVDAGFLMNGHILDTGIGQVIDIRSGLVTIK